MSKTLALNEIMDGEVKFISLVKRGANRVPFRLKKSEDGSMDLDIFSLFKKEEKPFEPFVANVVVKKGEDLEAAKALILKAGLSVDTVEETEAGTIFKQAEPKGVSMLVKTSESVGLQVCMQKSMQSFDFSITSFSDLWSTAGVAPTLEAATCVLKDVLYNIIYSAESGSTMASAFGKAIEEYKSMLTGLVQAVPKTAFKMEEETMIELSSLKQKPEETTPKKEVEKKPDAKATEDEGKAVEKKSDVNTPVVPPERVPHQDDRVDVIVEPVKPSDPNNPDNPSDPAAIAQAAQDEIRNGDAADDVTDELARGKKAANNKEVVPPVQKSDTDMTDAIVSKVLAGVEARLQKADEAFAEKLTKLEAAIGGAVSTADEAKKLAKSADKALGSTVLSEPAGDRAPVTAKKSEVDFMHFDTAYTGVPQ